MLKIGICDDQKVCAENLKCLLVNYLKKKQLDAEIAVFSSAEELLTGNWQDFHIIFLDVVMEQQDGVQAAKFIRRRNPDISLIFVSAFLDYATMGYQVKASAYLLKDQLAATLESAMDSVLTDRMLDRDHVDICSNDRIISLPLHKICFIESQGRSAVFHSDTLYQTNMRFSDVEALLASKGFLRIHRCYIINPAHCVTIKNYQAIMDTGEMLPCSRTEYSELVKKIMRWKGLNQ